MENNSTPQPPETSKPTGTPFEINLPDDPNDEFLCEGCQ